MAAFILSIAEFTFSLNSNGISFWVWKLPRIYQYTYSPGMYIHIYIYGAGVNQPIQIVCNSVGEIPLDRNSFKEIPENY